MTKKRITAWVFLNRGAIAACMTVGILAAAQFCRLLPAQAMMKPVNLAYLVKRADVIVQGRITNVVREDLPGYPNIPTVKVILDVEDMVRGPEGKTYTFREIVLGLRSKQGKMDYRTGQQILLFLPAPTDKGLSSPIGMEQGRFYISRNPAGEAVVANTFGNGGLFNDVAQAARNEGRRLTPSQLRLVSGESGPVRLSEFASLVKSLSSLKRIKDPTRID